MATSVFHRIQSIVLVEPFRLRAVFTDGVQKEYDLRRWKDHPAFSILFRHPALQTAVRLEPGGYGVSWNDNIDLAAEEIYNNGIDCETPDHVFETEPGRKPRGTQRPLSPWGGGDEKEELTVPLQNSSELRGTGGFYDIIER